MSNEQTCSPCAFPLTNMMRKDKEPKEGSPKRK